MTQGTAIAIEAAPWPLDPGLRLGPVALTVRDLDVTTAFWTSSIGLLELGREGDRTLLGIDGKSLVELRHRPDATVPQLDASGLFHVAIRLPTRRDLALALRRLCNRGVALQGATDHGISEALYLADPEGNGIELCRDREPGAWIWGPGEEGMMEPLDLPGLAVEAADDRIPDAMPSGADVGHVHLKVANLRAAIDWYRDVLGLDLTMFVPAAAGFLSAGGYHHHVGVNVWRSRGGTIPAPDSAGLAWATALLRDEEERDAVVERAAEWSPDDRGAESLEDTPVVHDPSGNAWRLLVRSA